MDETDLRLIGLLNTNSRTPFRDLAEKLGVSVQAVHKRVKALEEAGVILRYTANLSLKHLKAVPVGISGHTTAVPASDAAKALGKDDSTYLVHVSDDFFSIMVMLRSIGDLERYVEFLKKDTLMADISISLPSAMGFTSLERQNVAPEPLELTPVDFRIIRSLQGGARKEVVDIAGDVGISAKTVKRRLARMTEAGAIDFSTQFDLGAQNGISSIVTINLKPGSDKGRFMGEMKSRFGPRIIYMGVYSNIPDGVFIYIWSASLKESRAMEAAFQADERIAVFKNRLIQDKYQFRTWGEKLLEEKASGNH
jgi:DNA-binding Lrp family transcriptional regulator